jgi:hypothetical protein
MAATASDANFFWEDRTSRRAFPSSSADIMVDGAAHAARRGSSVVAAGPATRRRDWRSSRFRRNVLGTTTALASSSSSSRAAPRQTLLSCSCRWPFAVAADDESAVVVRAEVDHLLRLVMAGRNAKAIVAPGNVDINHGEAISRRRIMRWAFMVLWISSPMNRPRPTKCGQSVARKHSGSKIVSAFRFQTHSFISLAFIRTRVEHGFGVSSPASQRPFETDGQ